MASPRFFGEISYASYWLETLALGPPGSDATPLLGELEDSHPMYKFYYAA